MKIDQSYRKSAKAVLIYTSALFGAAFAVTLAPGAAAQDISDEGDAIVVTGSRIARDPNIGSTAPIQSVTAEQIEFGGAFNTIDVLNDVPALLFSTTSETSNQDTAFDGQNTLDLRGLGEERTLVLVNGRRFVSGVEGSQSVDVGAIPQALIQRVEVLTGGASAVYGADAVTGVVNFVLREDFEGLDVNIRGGLSSEGDADEYAGSVLWGRNFAEGRGNFTASLGYSNNPGLVFGDRDWAADNRVADNDSNPARRFQSGDISASTPNFASFYDYGTTGRYPRGFSIPTQAEFEADYFAEFGSTPTLTQAELALIGRAADAPSRAILPFHNFSISSRNGVIAPGDFSFPMIDTDSNGTEDCLDSYVGYNSQFALGGCWVPAGGVVRPYQDGLIAGDFNQFGGDGIENFFSEDILIPKEQRVTLNLTGRLEAAPGLTLFGEVLYSYHHIDTGGPLNTFYDLLYGDPENPYLPAELDALADSTGGLYITRDPTDLGENIDTNERRTFRTVIGAEWEWSDAWSMEISANYGEFALRATDRNYVVLDRFFAAIDVIDTDPGLGVTAACRSDVSGVAPPATPFGIPAWEAGFFSFTPGDGQCEPANIWAGDGAISEAAVDFITTTVVDQQTITQTVLSSTVVGELPYFAFPGGPIGIALGAEWRQETSRATFNSYDLGVLPEGTPFTPGQNINDVSGNFGLGFAGGESAFFNSFGEYDVWDVFGEISVPLLRGAPFAEELELDAAYRYSEYSTVGDASTWKVGLIWAPVADVRLRVSRSQSVRAPNISELFSPNQPAFFRPVDPCDVNELAAFAAADPTTAAIREANCATALTALGADPSTYTDPLSARFAGVQSGNPDLGAETAQTFTGGFVVQPRWIEGLSFSVDYWNIAIEDAIAAVSDQDIVDNCYDSPTFPNNYCTLFTRNDTPSSPQLGGFTFLRQAQINFGALEAEGVDIAVRYAFDLYGQDFDLSVQATRQSNLDLFFDPGDPTAVDPELGEIFRPEWSGNVGFAWTTGPLHLAWNTQYIGEQLLRAAEIETYESIYGAAAEADAVLLHDLAAQFDLNDSLKLFGGVENISDEEPYITEFSWPSGPRGRFIFIGLNAQW